MRFTKKQIWTWAIVGAVLVIVPGSFLLTFPKTFQLAKRAYRTLEEWAKDRANQLRAAFHVKTDALRPEGTRGPKELSVSAWNQAKLNTLAPAFRGRFSGFLSAAQAVARRYGYEYIIWDAARSLERQVELYKHGRTVPGDIVTQTVGGSRHLYGIAIDLAIKAASGSVSFDLPYWHKSEVLPLARKYRLRSLLLEAGMDPPHIEVPPEDLPESVQQAIAQLKSDFPGLG